MQTSDTLPLLKITPLSDCICVHGTYMKGGNEVVDTRDSRKSETKYRRNEKEIFPLLHFVLCATSLILMPPPLEQFTPQ